jgi:hypothetical protein
MIAPQSPTLQVFIAAHAVPGADMSSQRLSPIAAIQAHHKVVAYRSPHRYGGNPHLFWLGRLSQVTHLSVDCGDEIGNLICSQLMMPYVTPDDLRREIRIVFPGVH